MQGTISEIKKGKGIDDLVRGITPGRLEIERPVEVVGGRKFDDIMEKYYTYLELCMDVKRFFNVDAMVQCLPSKEDVLTPSEINAFLQATLKYEEHPAYSLSTGMFVNRLVQRSYDKKHNNFVLNARGLPLINGLGEHLRGTDEPLVLEIFGDVQNSMNVVQNVNITLHGDVKQDCCGYNSRGSIFTLYGGIKNDKGGATGNFSSDCTFGTTDEETLDHFSSHVAQIKYHNNKCRFEGPSQNKIVRLRQDGTEESVKYYGKEETNEREEATRRTGILWKLKNLFK